MPPGKAGRNVTSSSAAGNALSQSLHQWTKFLARCESRRLDPEKFACFVPMLYSKHRLPPAVIADLVMRPTRSNREALDPRTPLYLGVLLKLRMVDLGGVLRALLRYSSLHGEVRKGQQEEDEEMGNGGQQGGNDRKQQQQKRKLPAVRWRSSYAAEEIIFWRLIKAVSNSNVTGQGQGQPAGGGSGANNTNSKNEGIVGIRNGGDAVSVLKAVTQWMALFTEAAAAFSRDTFGAIHSLQAKGEIESSRATFLLLLVGVCENPVVLSVLGKDGSKGM